MRLPTVVIPVFNAAPELDKCLASVHVHTAARARVIVIDDASTDSGVAEVLDRWGGLAGSNWSFAANETNQGFVATANRGLEMADGDVVLLNSDTEVAAGWLQGLARCLASDAAIATATPWTNNGEIASMPVFCAPNPAPPDREAAARVIAATGTPSYPEIPTAVGFCMAISRRAVESVGLFDQRRFGRGYGEENDFSMRAAEAGMRNVLCDDVYVVHHGGRSFGPLGLAPDAGAMERLLERHPGYLDHVRDFISSDPLAGRRSELLRALDEAGVAMR